MSNIIRERKINLMKQKREDKGKDTLERFKIVGILESRYNELIREGQKEEEAVYNATTKVKKDLDKEKESYIKGNREDLIENINIQLDEVKQFLPAMMSKEEIGKVVEDLINNSEDNNFGKMMGMLNKQLKGKAEMKDVQQVLKDKLGI